MAKTVKTPGLTVYLDESVSSDADIARLVCSTLEYTVLGDITKLTEIYYDLEITNTIVPKDKEFVKLHYEFSDDTTQDDLRRLSPWVIRVELNPTVFLEKKMQMSEIVTQIKEEYGEDLNVIKTDDNADDLVIRVRTVNDVPHAHGRRRRSGRRRKSHHHPPS